jgi:hypothetical protein
VRFERFSECLQERGRITPTCGTRVKRSAHPTEEDRERTIRREGGRESAASKTPGGESRREPRRLGARQRSEFIDLLYVERRAERARAELFLCGATIGSRHEPPLRASAQHLGPHPIQKPFADRSKRPVTIAL